MDSRTMHPGKYLKASDFETAQLWSIADLRQEPIQNQQTGKADNKWILYFNEDDRGLVLNVTNRLALEDYLGFETDEWADKQVVVYRDKVSFGGKMVDAIRLREPRKAKAAAVKPKPAPPQESPAADMGDDEIPF